MIRKRWNRPWKAAAVVTGMTGAAPLGSSAQASSTTRTADGLTIRGEAYFAPPATAP